MLISYTSTTSKPGCSTLQLGFNDAACFDAYEIMFREYRKPQDATQCLKSRCGRPVHSILCIVFRIDLYMIMSLLGSAISDSI